MTDDGGVVGAGEDAAKEPATKAEEEDGRDDASDQHPGGAGPALLDVVGLERALRPLLPGPPRLNRGGRCAGAGGPRRPPPRPARRAPRPGPRPGPRPARPGGRPPPPPRPPRPVCS